MNRTRVKQSKLAQWTVEILHTTLREKLEEVEKIIPRRNNGRVKDEFSKLIYSDGDLPQIQNPL